LETETEPVVEFTEGATNQDFYKKFENELGHEVKIIFQGYLLSKLPELLPQSFDNQLVYVVRAPAPIDIRYTLAVTSGEGILDIPRDQKITGQTIWHHAMIAAGGREVSYILDSNDVPILPTSKEISAEKLADLDARRSGELYVTIIASGSSGGSSGSADNGSGPPRSRDLVRIRYFLAIDVEDGKLRIPGGQSVNGENIWAQAAQAVGEGRIYKIIDPSGGPILPDKAEHSKDTDVHILVSGLQAGGRSSRAYGQNSKRVRRRGSYTPRKLRSSSRKSKRGVSRRSRSKAKTTRRKF